MDRLVSGDVGFGKTEVALRAAFKCVLGGRQVAILAPTTVLAQQHFESFKERLARWPVSVELLSGYRTAKQKADVRARAAAGTVDVDVVVARMPCSPTARASVGSASSSSTKSTASASATRNASRSCAPRWTCSP